MEKNLTIIEKREVLGKEFKIYGDFENPLFLAKDVAEMIDYTQIRKGTYNVSAMLKNIDEDEKLVSTIMIQGQNRDVIMLTEDGLYEVLMQSRKPIAKEFKKEVKKILKTLRKTGGYVSNADMMVDTYFGALNSTHKELVKGLFQNIEEQQKQIAIQKPKAEYYDKLVDKNHLTNFRDTAKELGMKQSELINMLLDKKMIYRDSKRNLKPYSSFVDKGYFEMKDFYYNNITGVQTLITPNGKEYIIKIIDRY